MSVKIMVDSATDFTQQQAKELGLLFEPISVMLDGEEYFDGVNLFAEEFYDKLENCKEIPRTSLINEFRWYEAFENAIKDGSELIVITISSKLSGTYRAAMEASKSFNGKVFVIDSMNAACGEGLLAKYALILRDSGKSAQQISDILNEKKSDICVYALIDTLKYLKKGGRISTATAIIGTTLSIKPIIGVIDGEVKMIGKTMGNKKGNLMLNGIVSDSGGIDFDMPWTYLCSGNDKTNIEKYINDSKRLVEDRQSSISVLGSTIGTHIGSGAVGLAYFKKSKNN